VEKHFLAGAGAPASATAYNAIQGYILMMNPVLNVVKAYAFVVQVQKQSSLESIRKVADNFVMVVYKTESVALVARCGQDVSSHFISANSKPLHCSYCDHNHHVQETCWKLNGYAPEYPKHLSNNRHHSWSSPNNAQSKYNNGPQVSTNNVKKG
jgi:hypothetical protein